MEEKEKEFTNIEEVINDFAKNFNQKRKFPDQIKDFNVEVHPIFSRHIL
jgi:hypothetical protein